jgi:hypothetical protein
MHRSAGRSNAKAAEQLNVSPRLVALADRLLRDDKQEVIAAIESGELAVTRAATRRNKVPAKRFHILRCPDHIILIWMREEHEEAGIEALKSRGFEREE